MKTTRTALACFGTVVAIVGCAHLRSDGEKPAGTHVLTLKHQGYPSNPNQTEHAYRSIKWWLKEGARPGFAIRVKSNDWIEWHNPDEPNFAIAVAHTNSWKTAAGSGWISIPNLGTWPGVATTNGHVRLQFTPDADTKSGPINYRIAIPPLSEIYAKEAPQSNYCNVDIVEETVVWGGGFTNPVSRANTKTKAQ